ncbi:MAG: GNAT family N-acetyltransferase [Candidatus Syntrophosphaera sp.]
MEFDLDECVVRLARPSDKADLTRVARGIWGGGDYLPKVFDRWVREPWFWVCEYQGRAIACLKMTRFPDDVLWFEGLRVQVRYQNHGIAKFLNRHSFLVASKLRRENPAIAYEFATYYLNVESLHLTQKLGFRVVEKFYSLKKRGVAKTEKPGVLRNIELAAFRNYPAYIPCAWQSVHNTEASLGFLQEHGFLFQTPHARYYFGGLHDPCVTLLEPPSSSLREDLPYIQHFYGSRKSYDLIMPSSFCSSLPLLHKHGFRVWGDERVENMLVLRM